MRLGGLAHALLPAFVVASGLASSWTAPAAQSAEAPPVSLHLQIRAPEPPAEPDATPPVVSSPLGRKALPPGGVSSFLSFGQGGNLDLCVLGPGGTVRHGFQADQPGCQLTVADPTPVAFEAFRGSDRVTVDVTRSDGSTRQLVAMRPTGVVGAPANARPVLTWLARPGDPYGDYDLVATAGQSVERYTVTVAPAARPLAAVTTRTIAPGGIVEVVVAGYSPGADVPVHLYRLTSGDPRAVYTYLTVGGRATADARGEGVVSMQTAPDDSEDEYMVQTDPPVVGFLGALPLHFSLRRDPTAGRSDRLLNPTDDDVRRFAQATIEQANAVWASVVAEDGGPIDRLACVYAGDWLDRVRGEVAQMRARGQYRAARMTAPVEVRTARRVSDDVLDVEVAESWDDRLLAADGSLVRIVPGHVEQRYVLRKNEAAGFVDQTLCTGPIEGHSFYLIVESELRRAT